MSNSRPNRVPSSWNRSLTRRRLAASRRDALNNPARVDFTDHQAALTSEGSRLTDLLMRNYERLAHFDGSPSANEIMRRASNMAIREEILSRFGPEDESGSNSINDNEDDYDEGDDDYDEDDDADDNLYIQYLEMTNNGSASSSGAAGPSTQRQKKVLKAEDIGLDFDFQLSPKKSEAQVCEDPRFKKVTIEIVDAPKVERRNNVAGSCPAFENVDEPIDIYGFLE